MSIRKIELINNELYHIYDRGVDKRDIFLDEEDFGFFIKRIHKFKIDNKEKLVEIYGYSLLKNHFHLLLKQVRDNGTTKFMHKLKTSYAMYFNKKYKRTGTLFSSKFNAKIILNDDYFKTVFPYVVFNGEIHKTKYFNSLNDIFVNNRAILKYFSSIGEFKSYAKDIVDTISTRRKILKELEE